MSDYWGEIIMQGKVDISVYAKEAQKFENDIKPLKNSANVDFNWYPYPILSNLNNLDLLLTGENRYFFQCLRKDVIFLILGLQTDIWHFFRKRRGSMLIFWIILKRTLMTCVGQEN